MDPKQSFQARAEEGINMVDREELLTTSDAAKVLRVSTDWIRELERKGRLPALKTRSGQRLFKAVDVEDFAQARAITQEVGEPVLAAH
jgi:excisionase family DNA binding protein